MLNEHHGNVVRFLRVGHVDDVTGPRLELDGLVIEHPVGDVLEAFLLGDVDGLIGLSQGGSESASRALARELLDRIARFLNIEALVLDLLHAELRIAVTHELPTRL